jgi:uncharacterized protein
MSDFPVTDLTRVRRLPERGTYDAESVHSIIDAVLVSHVGFTIDDRPFVIPVLHARDGDRLLLHGASSSRLLRHIVAGHPLCVCITAIDGLVLAKTAFNQSVNYRSVVIFGQGTLIEDPVDKLHALTTLTNRLVPGQWDHVRHPDTQELKATSIVGVPITEASAKVRNGPPKDDPEDQEFPAWAGVVPIFQVMGTPTPVSYSDPNVAVPAHIQALIAAHQPPRGES